MAFLGVVFRILLILPFQGIHSNFAYDILSSFTPIDNLNSCVGNNPPKSINCIFYQPKGIRIESICVSSDVYRIIGEFDTFLTICTSDDEIDFSYVGMQPMEAIRVEYFKEVRPLTAGKDSKFGIAVYVSSVESLYQFYSNQFKQNPNPLPRIDYPRSGHFIFRSHFQINQTSFFIYFEDSARPSFLRNHKTRASLDGDFVYLPCIPSHYELPIQVEFQNQPLQFMKSNGTDQGLMVQVPRHNGRGRYGVYTCTMITPDGITDVLELELLRMSDKSSTERFGLNQSIPRNCDPANLNIPTIKYISKEFSGGEIEIRVTCQFHRLSQHQFYLATIEAQNHATLTLRKEFIFPAFVNQSYSVQVNQGGRTDLSFQVQLDKRLRSRTGGATYCADGNDFTAEEFSVSFAGVSRREFDIDRVDIKWENVFLNTFISITPLVSPEKCTGIPEPQLKSQDATQFYAGMNVTFECKFITAVVVKPVIWYTIWRNGSRIEELLDYNWVGYLEDTSYFRKELHRDLLRVQCSASYYDSNDWKVAMLPISVKDGTKPKIARSSGHLTLQKGAKNQGLICTASGLPSPDMSWFRGGNQLFAVSTGNGSIFHQIPKVETSHGGDYLCRAQNIYGIDEKIFHYIVESPDGTNLGLLIGISLAVFCLTCLSAYIYIRFIRKEKVGLTSAEIEEFLRGQPNAIRSSNDYEVADICPYNTSYEVAPQRYTIDRDSVLGTGAFGIVLKGSVDGKTVAVKTTQNNADKAYLKALLSELKMMIYLGYHENVLQLIGASTKDLKNGAVYIFVPFCGLGNLENYLRANRHLYRSSNTSPQAAKFETGVIDFQCLLNWGLQVSRGMEYLNSRKVVHGDLAARNVLLKDDRSAVIMDFGLSRKLYAYTYVKKNQEPLPWRWMAIESLRDLSFSTSSDVWSYGVFLWELFSLGDVPYPGMSWTLDFVDQLENGLRMSIPKYASGHLFHRVLQPCWENEPSHRPSFGDLCLLLAEECSQSTQPREMYFNLS